MKASQHVTEFDLLECFVEEMERRGENKNLIRLDVDAQLAMSLSEKLGCNITEERLQGFADRCLANEWLEHRVMGGKYLQLGLTTAGLGVVRSRQRKQQLLAQRSKLKRLSDYIEDHKGLFVALGASIALVSLLVKLFLG